MALHHYEILLPRYGYEVDSLFVEVAANVLRKPHKAKEVSVLTYRFVLFNVVGRKFTNGEKNQR